MCFFTMGSLSAQYNAEVVKAAYIERVTRFIEWPPSGIARDSDFFVIGVYKEPKFYNTLKEVFKDKTIKERRVRILDITNSDQMKGCDICYVSEKARPEILKFITEANRMGVLLMSQAENFCEAGIHINFFIEDDKLKFEINKQSTDSAKFKLSSLLLRSSKIIQ